MNKLFMAACLAILALAQLPAAQAEEGFIDGRQCLVCHKDMKQAYQETAHGRAFAHGDDKSAGCQSCHGGGAAHKEVADQDNPQGPWKIESFKKAAETPGEKNRPCLTCHENKQHANWRGSPHDMGGVSCTDCHTLHKAKDTVRQDICFTCHQSKRAQMLHSPLTPRQEGARECAKCHDPHGGTGPSLLKTATVNDNCYGCHAEKRGPFLWEHAPVRDNCATCHDVHGKSSDNLLRQRAPYLCQNCHSTNFHPSTLYSGNQLPGGASGADKHIVGKSCLNCHPMVHGSNHPSGARFNR